MDKYYQLLDANSANVSPLWKVTHVLSMLFATISGFISAYTLGKAIEAFNNHCILFAHIEFSQNSTIPEALKELPDYFHEINLQATDWGKTSQCYFCQFTPVMSMISGLIWGAFFIICSKGGAGYISDAIYRPWRIIYPAMMFTIIAIGLLLFSTLELSSGINIFCAQFKDIFNTTQCTKHIDQYTLFFSDTEKPLIILLQVSFITSVICLICWIAQLITLILRVLCVADFEMFKITVTFPSDSTEILQGVIDPDNASILDDNISNTSKSSIISKKLNFKRGLFKSFPANFFKHISKLKRTSSSSSYDPTFDLDIDHNISLNTSISSFKPDNDNRSIIETSSLISSDLSSLILIDKEANRDDIENQDNYNIVFEDTGYSSLFFPKKRKRAKKVEEPRESFNFVPHQNESFLSHVIYSNQNENNDNISINEIEIVNSASNIIKQSVLNAIAQLESTIEKEKYVPNFRINNINLDENIDNSDHSSFADRYRSFGFVQQPFLLRNDIFPNELIEPKSPENLGVILEEGKKYNYSTSDNNLMNFSQPIQLVNYEPKSYTDSENMSDIVIATIDTVSNENVVISRTRIATIPNYEHVSNSIQNGHANLKSVNEEIEIPSTSKSSSSFSSVTESAPYPVVITPSSLAVQNRNENPKITDETINLNNDIHNSNTILNVARNRHRLGYSQNFPDIFQQNRGGYEEIPPYQVREELRNNPTEDSYNYIRDMILRIYMILWFMVVLRNLLSF